MNDKKKHLRPVSYTHLDVYKRQKQANARRMKALNLPVETICQVTGLSAGEIENL